MKRRTWLTQRRLEKGFTQIELAKKVGVSNQTISDIERGVRNPSPKLAMKISKVLGFDMSYFYKDLAS